MEDGDIIVSWNAAIRSDDILQYIEVCITKNLHKPDKTKKSPMYINSYFNIASCIIERTEHNDQNAAEKKMDRLVSVV